MGGLGKEKEGSGGGRETGVCDACSTHWRVVAQSRACREIQVSQFLSAKGAHGESLTVAKKMEKRTVLREML